MRFVLGASIVSVLSYCVAEMRVMPAGIVKSEMRISTNVPCNRPVVLPICPVPVSDDLAAKRKLGSVVLPCEPDRLPFSSRLPTIVRPGVAV